MGLLYLFLAIWIVSYAMKRKQWSWPAFGWILLLAVIVGGAAIGAGLMVVDRVGPGNDGVSLGVFFGLIAAAVLIITFLAIKIERHYIKPPYL